MGEQSVYTLFLYPARLESTPNITLMAFLWRFWPTVLSISLAAHTVPSLHIFPSQIPWFRLTREYRRLQILLTHFSLLHLNLVPCGIIYDNQEGFLFSLVWLLSAGGLAAQEPGQCFERGSMRCHPDIEEKTSEHVELHTCSAQERSLETSGPTGEHLEHSLKQHY